jgi:hypothetical protein
MFSAAAATRPWPPQLVKGEACERRWTPLRRPDGRLSGRRKTLNVKCHFAGPTETDLRSERITATAPHPEIELASPEGAGRWRGRARGYLVAEARSAFPGSALRALSACGGWTKVPPPPHHGWRERSRLQPASRRRGSAAPNTRLLRRGAGAPLVTAGGERGVTCRAVKTPSPPLRSALGASVTVER